MRIVLCAVLLGGLWRLNEYYVWMALRGYSVRAADPELEKRVWNALPAEGLRFWPSFLSKSQEMSVFLERTVPVFVDTRMTGWGVFVTDIRRLSPWVTVEWRGRLWRISREARMWSLDEERAWGGEPEISARPLWRVASSPVSGDELSGPEGVFPVIFSTAPIEDFMTEFGNEPWFDNIEEIVLDRQEGATLFRLRLRREGQEFAILIQKEKYTGRKLHLALEQILNRLREEGGDHVIDATYENNKILWRPLSADVREGSLK